jgi:transcriptional regulator with XRE-family HTH domain
LQLRIKEDDVTRLVTDQQRRNQAEQARLYGEPLGDLLRELGSLLGLSQGRLAEVLGVSAPMLSQLASGHRVKLGNPTAVSRLQRLMELAHEVREGGLDPAAAVEQARSDTPGPVLTVSTRVTPRRGAEATRRLFRAVAPPADYLAAAELLEGGHPAVAELLRVYGAGPTDAAEVHFGDRLGG